MKQNSLISENQKAFNYALLLLSFRSRTVLEIRERMAEKKYSEQAITDTINKLYELKLLDDEQYAKDFINSAVEYGNHGYYYLVQKMRLRKFAEELITNVLEEKFIPEKELIIAKKLLGNFGNVTAKNEFALKQKIANRLKTRGFRSETIAKAVFEN